MKISTGAAGARFSTTATLLALFSLATLGACGGGPAGGASDSPRGSGGAANTGGAPAGSGGRGAGGAAGESAGSGGRSGAGGSGPGGSRADAGPASDSGAPAVTDGGRPGTGGSSGTRPPTSSPPATVSDAGSPAAGPAGPWARGLTLGLVEVTQGVFVKIGEGGTVLDPAMRNAPLIEGRPLFVRAYVTPGAGFSPRRLRGVLTVEYGAGSSKSVEEARMVSGASDPERLDSTFNFLLPAADVKPSSSLSVAIYEMGAAEGADPSPLPRFPAMGAADLAVKAGRMVLDVVAMPVTGPMGALEDTPARRTKLINDLYDMYPVQQVNLRVREPFVTATRLTSSSAGFTALREARMKDGAKPWEYYHLFVGPGDNNFSFAGVASGAGASVNDANRRVAITKVSTRGIDGNTNTFAHEVGHNHGRNHAPACGASGGDSMYPYAMGNMGVNGFSLSTLTLKSKSSFKELMGYCRPRWISDYTYKMLEARVRIVSAFPGNGDGTPPVTTLSNRSLQAYAGPGETPSFGVVPGHLVDAATPRTPTRTARLHLADGTTQDVPVAVQLLSDDVTAEISVNLPTAEVTRAEVTVDGKKFTVDVSAL